MKFFLILLVVLVGVFAWRKGRSGKPPRPTQPPGAGANPSDAPQEMISCPVCGVHMPRNEALIGRNGAYCSPAHRQQGEA